MSSSNPAPPDRETAWVPEAAEAPLPRRYSLRSEGESWYLTCVEAPNLRVRSVADRSVSSAGARRAAPGTIFLDGAAQGEPFLDVERRVYNLDHHEGCVRAFTLATCEQALVLVRKGFDLKIGDWTVVIGEPDLDTVLAVWVLLNHRRLTTDEAVRRRITPLVRLEGWIDAHGLELAELSGLPESLQAEVLATIDSLRRRELELKRTGEWSEADPLEYVLAVLGLVDGLVYTSEHFSDLPDVDELGRVAVARGRIAILCRAEVGIYEAERHLRALHGERLGLIILHKDSRTYTLRLTDAFLPKGLEPLYSGLNRVDPAVRGDDRWGGSSEIGGSPRRRGSSLSSNDVLAVCRAVYSPASIGRRVARIAAAAGLAAVVTIVLGVAGGPRLPGAWSGSLLRSPATVWPMTSVLALAAAAVLVPTARRFPRGFGLSLPRGGLWAMLLPAGAIAGLAGGAWILAPTGRSVSIPSFLAGAAVLAAACELFFRGALHGLLAEVCRPAVRRGSWTLTGPTVVAAVLSAASWTFLSAGEGFVIGAAALARSAMAGFALGLTCGLARERSGSVLGAVAVHSVAALAGAAMLLLAR